MVLQSTRKSTQGHQGAEHLNAPVMRALAQWKQNGRPEDAQRAAQLIAAGTTPGTWKRGSIHYRAMAELVLSAPHPDLIRAFESHPWFWAEADLRVINLGTPDSAESLQALLAHFTSERVSQHRKRLDETSPADDFSAALLAMGLLDLVTDYFSEDQRAAVHTWEAFVAQGLTNQDRAEFLSPIAAPGEALIDRTPAGRRQTRWLGRNLERSVRSGAGSEALACMGRLLHLVAPKPRQVAQIIAVSWGPGDEGFTQPMTTGRWKSWQGAAEAYPVIQEGLDALDNWLAQSAKEANKGITSMITDIRAGEKIGLWLGYLNDAQHGQEAISPLGWEKDVLEGWAYRQSLQMGKMRTTYGENFVWVPDRAELDKRGEPEVTWGVSFLGDLSPDELDNARACLLNYDWDISKWRASPNVAIANDALEYLCARGEPLLPDLVRDDPDFWTDLWNRRPDLLMSCIASLPRRKLLELLANEKLKEWRDQQGNTIAHMVLMEHGKTVSVYLGAALKKYQAHHLGEPNTAGYTPLEIASFKGLAAPERAKLDLFLLRGPTSSTSDEGRRKKTRSAGRPPRRM